MFHRSRAILIASLGLLILAFFAQAAFSVPPPDGQVQFSITFPKERSAQPLDGRMLLLLSNDPSAEPRTQINLSAKTQIVFGIDVVDLAPGRIVNMNDANSFGYPIRYLRDVPPGDYFVQGCSIVTKPFIGPTAIS
jgi:hypothetical protein